MRVLGELALWAIGLVFGVFLIGIIIDICRTYIFPPDRAYFEAFLNWKYSDYRKMDGRVLKCDTPERDAQGYEIRCQYYRGEIGEEFTYQWFAPNGDYIGTLDGG